jgi:hypothetical protein
MKYLVLAAGLFIVTLTGTCWFIGSMPREIPPYCEMRDFQEPGSPCEATVVASARPGDPVPPWLEKLSGNLTATFLRPVDIWLTKAGWYYVVPTDDGHDDVMDVTCDADCCMGEVNGQGKGVVINPPGEGA